MKSTIALEGMQFHAYHGIYPIEKERGNTFEVDLTVEVDLVSDLKDDINNTVDYEVLFAIVKGEMEKPAKLIETVAANILEVVFETCAGVDRAEVKLSKLDPPIGGDCKRASVTLARSR